MSHDRSSHVVRRDDLPGAWTSTRSLVLVVLGCALVAKLFDALPHPDAGYVPFVLAVFVLPFWRASGVGASVWERHRGPLLAVQATLTYVPFAVFGEHWVGGVSGLFAGLVLLVVPGRSGWIMYAVLTATELTLWSLVGLPYEPRANAVVWLLVAFANQSLILFGLTRLADLVRELDANRDALAEIEVTRQRLAATRHLRETVQQRLQRVTVLLETGLASGTPAATRSAVLDAGRAARDAASDARRLTLDLPDQARAPIGLRSSETVAPRLARAIAVAVLAVFATQYLANIILPTAKERPGWLVSVLAMLVALTVVALQLRHSTARADGRRPAGWPVTLVVEGMLCLVFYPAAGAASLALVGFVAASGLLLLSHWSRWVLFAAAVATLPGLALLDPAIDEWTLGETLTWALYAGATMAAASLLFFGLARLAQTAGQLREVQEQIAGAARTQERLRLARDAHDTLGLGLSTIALKTDLAAALADQDPARSRQEVVQALHVTRLVATDVEAVSGDRVTFTFATEVATAELSLKAAGVHTEIDIDPAAQHVEALAAVLREAVTNVLRHSRATRCRIRLTRTEAATVLVVSNDGITTVSGGEPGRGLANMSERMHGVHGTLTSRIHEGEFTLTAELPAAPDAGHRDVVPVLQA
jgi:two-component system sensor histidine kinase DesK